MKVEVQTVDGSEIPKLIIKPETAADEMVLNAIVNNQGAVPSQDFCLMATVVNGASFSSITISEFLA